MKRAPQPAPTERPLNVRQVQEVQLTREHWVNGNRFCPGTVLCLPASCALNLIEAGAARTVPDELIPSNDPAEKGS